MLDLTVHTPEDAGISAVAGIRVELMAAIEQARRGSTITLDLSRTRKSDSSLAQLIVSCKAEAAAKGLKLEVKAAGEEQSLLSMLSCDSMGERAGGTA